MFDLDPSFSKAVAGILRWYEKRTTKLNSSGMLKQRQRAIYYQRYPFGQKQKAKVLASGAFNVAKFNQHPRMSHIETQRGSNDWRKFVDKVSKPD